MAVGVFVILRPCARSQNVFHRDELSYDHGIFKVIEGGDSLYVDKLLNPREASMCVVDVATPSLMLKVRQFSSSSTYSLLVYVQTFMLGMLEGLRGWFRIGQLRFRNTLLELVWELADF